MRGVGVCLTALLVLLGAAPSLPADPPLNEQLTTMQSAHRISALAWCIVSADRILQLHTSGHHSHERRISFTPSSLVRIGSISKTFTALATLLATREFDITLADPVPVHLADPPYDNPWRDSHPVTVAQLLEHTAGLRDLSRAEFAFNDPVTLGEAFLVDPASRRLQWPPGKYTSYSNSGAGIAAAVLQAVAGQPFEDYVESRVFAPLGLGSASFEPPEDPNRSLVHGFDSDGTTPIPYWHQLYRAFGAINISTDDMAKFVQFFLNRGTIDGERIVPAPLIDRMERPRTSLAARNGLSYGYGLGLYQFQRNGVSFFGHGGDADGYLSFFAYSPELGRGYFIVINAFTGTVMKRMRRILENHLTRDAEVDYPAPYPLSDPARDVITGSYRAATARFGSPSPDDDDGTLVIGLDSGELYTRIGEGEAKPLIPVRRGQFRRPWQSVATIAVNRDSDAVVLQGDFGNYVKITR